MNQSIQIEEQGKPNWKILTAIFTVVAGILFLIYWNITDIFWAGTFRLASFMSFAAAVLCGLKAIEGPLNLQIESAEKSLKLSYFKKGKKLHEETHERDGLKIIRCVQAASPLPGIDEYAFIINFSDSEQNYDLLHFGGRTLKLSKNEAEKVISFLTDHNFPVNEHIETKTKY